MRFGIFLLFICDFFCAFSASATLRSRACKDALSLKKHSVGKITEGPKDSDLRKIARIYGKRPAIYRYTGGSYGAAPENIPLFRGVTGPDHDFESVLRLIGGDRQYDLMSPTFRRARDKVLATTTSDAAYERARRETAREIKRALAELGLMNFAAAMTSGSSTGLSPEEKRGPIVKFTNDLNSALNYAGSNFERNLHAGRRLHPVVFDASGNGGLTLGSAGVPKPGQYEEYDFFSHVSIRHIKVIYVGLVQPDSATIWDMPWIKITPQIRGADGAFQSFSVEFVTAERKIPIEIYEKTNEWPTYELTNLTPRKCVGYFDLNGSIHLSPDLSDSERSHLRCLFELLEKLWGLRQFFLDNEARGFCSQSQQL